jgi:MoaA/NifB/PqqE/SkfB family radical SAM enzyme
VRRFFSKRPGQPAHTFCNEPWLGVVAVQVNQDVTFCPCYMKLRLGNLDEQPLEELWNAPALVEIRKDFRAGRLPAACSGELCPPAVGAHSHLALVPELPRDDGSASLPGPA